MLLRKYLVIGAIFLVQLCVCAQNSEESVSLREISGTIRDSLNMKELKGVTITLIEESNQKIIDMQVTDKSGDFTFFMDKNIACQIKITMIGYRTKLLQDIEQGNLPAKLGTIVLSYDIKELESVEISAVKSILENKLDRLVVHVERDAMLDGATALDALRKVPMVAIDMEDRISLRSNQQVRILINGKPSGMTGSHVADALRMLSANQIQTIEVMVNPTAKYDAEGGGVINIITKKRIQQNSHGTIASTIGTRQGDWNAGLNFGGQRIGLSTHIGNTWSWPVMTQITSEHRTSDGRLVAFQHNDSKNRRLGYQTNIVMDFQVDTNNIFTSTFNFNRFAILTKNKITNPYHMIDLLPILNNSKQMSGGLDWSLDYRRGLRMKGQELAMSVQLSTSKNDMDLSVDSPQFLEKVRNFGANKETTLQIDYVHPIGMTKVELGAKAIFRDITSETIQGIHIAQDPSHVSNDGSLTYRQQVTAAYTSLTMDIGKDIQAIYGLRYEHTFLANNTDKGAEGFVHRYNHLIPNIILGYQVHEKLGLKTSYSQRIARPSLYFLNPFLNTSDPINQQQGNPALRAELAHNLELASNLVDRNLMMSMTVYFRKTSDIIESIYTPRNQGNQTLMLQQFDNIGEAYVYGINMFASTTLFKVLSFRANLDFNLQEIRPYSQYTSHSIYVNRWLSNYKSFAGAAVDLKKGYLVESYVFFDSPQRVFQGHYSAFNLCTFTIKKKIGTDSGTVGLNLVDPFSRRKNLPSNFRTPTHEVSGNFILPFRSLGVNLSWKFGKGKYSSRNRKIINSDQKIEGNAGR